MLTVNITADDIKQGERLSLTHNPVSLALKRAIETAYQDGPVDIVVSMQSDTAYDCLHSVTYFLPPSAQAYLRYYNAKGKRRAKPYTFAVLR